MTRWTCRLVVLLCFAAGSADAAPPDVSNDALAATVSKERSYTEGQRKALVTQNLDLGRDEAAGFWPLYRDYRGAMAKIQDDRVKIIADYAKNYRSMTPDLARSLLEGNLRTDEAVLKLKRQYLSKFRKVLPETKVARYYQIENKMDALLTAEISVQIPLMLTAPR